MSGNPLVFSAIASTASVPLLLAFIDGFRPRNMTFDFPNSKGIYHTGQKYDLFMHTFGLASRFHLRTADLYLLNSNFQKVLKIASESEFKVLKNLTRSKAGMPQTAIGTMQFKIPTNISDGYYYIKYVSGWTIWRHESKFSAISNVFGITNNFKCNSLDCLKVSTATIIDPKSFTAQNAPNELQFLFSHTDKVVVKTLDGVVDGMAAIPKAIIHPNIRHPIESSKNATTEWEKKFERDPFGATGQVVGAGLAIGIPAKLISEKYKKCPDGLCGINAKAETHLFRVDGTTCTVVMHKPSEKGSSYHLPTFLTYLLS